MSGLLNFSRVISFVADVNVNVNVNDMSKVLLSFHHGISLQAEAYLEHIRRSRMELFVKIINGY